jgi:aminopeptidase N
MEYPMLTLDGGKDPGYRGLLVHEIAHNWFYGMVGNNETYRAALDEGFTQFLTAWGLRRIDGDTLKEEEPKSKYRKYFKEPEMVLDKRVFAAYQYDALNKDELPLNTHSDDFHNALGHEGGYRGVYYKTASMLYNLQYVLGDSLFQKALKNYFAQWQFAHPYFEDFRNSIIQYTHVDLNWFFDQWLETTKRIDYGICNIKKLPGNDSFAVKFYRAGEMHMPVDFTVTSKRGTKYNYHIPNTWFNKSTDATTLPKWYGWGKMHETYTAQVQIPGGIKHVEIDTSARLTDVYMLDNYKSRGLPISPKAFEFKLDGLMSAGWDRRQYRAYVRPDVWYNPVDGLKIGAHIEGDYLFSMHKLDATVWVNTHFFQKYDYKSYQSEGWYERYAMLNYSFNYISPIKRTLPKLQLQVNSRLLDGLWYHRGGLNWLLNSNNTLSVYGQTMWRAISYDLDYLIYKSEWSSTRGRANSSLNASWAHQYKYMRGAGNYTLSLRTPLLTGNGTNDFNYSYAQMEAVNINRYKKLEVRTRLFARYGTGTNIPYESALFLAGNNPEGMMEDKYTRTIGFVSTGWRSFSSTEMNHFQQGGGLNLRGYAGYFVGDAVGSEILVGYKGRGGISGSIEVDFDEYIKLKPKKIRDYLHADVYAFADAGIMQLNRIASLTQYWNIFPSTTFSDLRIDAGVGAAFTIKKFGPFEKVKPLTLRIDIPFFVNRPPAANPDYLGMRYVIGVNRTF